MSTFTDAQLDGWACVKCGTDLRTIPKSYFIGYGPRGQLFACPDHASPADRALMRGEDSPMTNKPVPPAISVRASRKPSLRQLTPPPSSPSG